MRYIIYGFVNVYYLSLLGGFIRSENDMLILSMLFIVPTGLWHILLFFEVAMKKTLKNLMLYKN